ncbi:hypothetical protein IMSAGC002_04288 [Lachnospiraceae bacterium]|jgi:hypothetical protein|nr:hypothetical protein IMSAGC002_04288 [Lachnospiraceae bacterium]
MEITYHWEGDYLIPDLKLSDTTEYHIGKYGRMRQRFLKENHGGVYSYMILLETLWEHLAEIDEACYGAVKGEQSSPHCIKNANGGILKKSKLGIDRN